MLMRVPKFRASGSVSMFGFCISMFQSIAPQRNEMSIRKFYGKIMSQLIVPNWHGNFGIILVQTMKRRLTDMNMRKWLKSKG